LQMNSPDTSSAEWIAEAPSQCDGGGNCQPLPLANFGSVSFSDATATAGGHTGPISDPAWSSQAVALSPGSDTLGYPGADFSSYTGGQSSSAGAQPSSLSSDGSGFTVSYQPNGPSVSTSAGSGAGQGDGYGGGVPGGDGNGYGYGAGDPGGYGYGYGDGYGYGGGYGYGYGGGYPGDYGYGAGGGYYGAGGLTY
jgi:Peptidase A4 family